VEEVAEAAVELLEVADVLQLLEEIFERLAGLGTEQVLLVAQPLQGLRDAVRQLLEPLAPPLRLLLVGELVERLALGV
jgi:hypothetical protein